MTRTIAIATLQLALVALAGCSSNDVPSETSPDASERARTIPAPVVETPAPAVPAPMPAAHVVEEQRPDAVDTPDVADDPLAEGRAAFRRGEMQVAAVNLGHAVRRGEGVTYDRYMLGLALWKSGDLAGAEAVLSDVSWKQQDFARAAVNLARVRIERGDLEGAETAASRAIESDPDFSDAHNVLGRALLARGDVDGAAAAFHRAASLDSTNPWPLNNLGYGLLVAGRPDEAVDPLEQAVARDEALAVAWHNLALARERNGDLAGAALAAARADALDGGSAPYAATAQRLAAIAPSAVPAAPVGPDGDATGDGTAQDLASSETEAPAGGGSSSLP